MRSRVGDLHVPRQPDLLERPDRPPAHVHLAGAQAVDRRAGEGVVVVVPALAERRQRHDPVVAALVLGLVGPAAERVAHGVHAPRHVVEQEDPYEAAPHHPGQAALPRGVDRVADGERDPQGQDHPQHVEAVERPDERVVVQVAPVAPAALHALGGHEPAHVRVEEAGEAPEHAVAPVRRVGVPLAVGERVVLAVVGHPLGHGALDRHGAQDREGRANRRVRLERPVGEQAVEPHRDAEAAQRVERRQHDHVHGADGGLPQQAHRGEHAEGRHHHRDEGDDAARDARARSDRGDRRTSDGELGHVAGTPVRWMAWSVAGGAGRGPSSVYGPDPYTDEVEARQGHPDRGRRP